MEQGTLEFFSMLGTLIMMIAVFIGAYFASKIVATRYQGASGSTKNSIEIIDRKMLGREQSLITVRTAGKVFLLGITAQQINKIDELDGSFFEESLTAIQAKPDFLNTLKFALKKTSSEKKEGEDK